MFILIFKYFLFYHVNILLVYLEGTRIFEGWHCSSEVEIIKPLDGQLTPYLWPLYDHRLKLSGLEQPVPASFLQKPTIFAVVWYRLSKFPLSPHQSNQNKRQSIFEFILQRLLHSLDSRRHILRYPLPCHYQMSGFFSMAFLNHLPGYHIFII